MKSNDRNSVVFQKWQLSLFACFSLLFSILYFGEISAQQGSSLKQKIIPAPRMVEANSSHFYLSRDTSLLINNEAAMGAAQYFQKFVIPATGYHLKIQHTDKPKEGAINLFISDGFTSAEAYELSVKSDKIIIRAATNKGLFYGLQSLRQMLPPEIESLYPYNDIDWVIAGVEIKDSPHYPFRGMHLDVSRHFFSKDFILRYIDFLALHKMNVFHWHLTDDQGWRIEIKKYPKLTSVGSRRAETVIGHPYDRIHYYDGKPLVGFYSQQDIKQIVKYAT